MNISAEISLYPLTENYESPILSFIHRLKARPGLLVATNGLSTQLTGPYDKVMDALKEAMKPTLNDTVTCSFVIKILNVSIRPGENVAVE